MADQIQVDLIVKAIAEGFDQVAKEQSKVSDEVKKQPGILDKVKDNWFAVAGGITAALAAVQSLKKIWDFAQEGAQIRQTADSFDYLMGKLGIARDLLGDLRQAAKGTVDDMTLMSATETLLAGTSDTLGRQLANATPQLLEIAKAANKLNPSLGDVAYQYQSIATGIKRASPMILDNLGLTIKVGQANEEYAASIGKTTDELTAEEKQLALLAAALKAGDKLIAQVGGSTDSAADAFQRLSAEQKNAWDRLKAGISEALEPAAAKMADALEASNRYSRALQTLGYDANEVSYALKYQGEYLGQTKEEIIANAERVQGLAEGYAIMAQEARGAGHGTQYFVEQLDEVPEKKTVEINLSIPTDAEKFIEESIFAQAGGAGLSVTVDKVVGPGGEALDESVRRQFATQAVAIDAAIKVDAGLIDVAEAKKTVSDALGITPAEAQALIDPYLGEGKKAAEQLGKDVDAALSQAHQDLQDAGAFQQLFSKPVRDVNAIKEQLDRLEERTVTVYIQYKTVGQPPDQRASGGPLGNLTLVGERGPELIIGNTVIDAATTRRLMSLGVYPANRRAVAGPIGGGGSTSSGGGSVDYDPLNTEQRTQVSQGGGGGGGSGGGGGGSTTTDSTGGGTSQTTIDQAIKAVESSIPQTVAATIRPILQTQLGQLAAQAARQERQGAEQVRLLRDISGGVRRLLTADDARVAFREGAQSINREL